MSEEQQDQKMTTSAAGFVPQVEKMPLWTWKQTFMFMEERFEKDVFFCYTSTTDVFPFEVKIGFTFVCKVVWFFIAIYVTTLYYITDQQSEYLSLENNAGCTEVPIAIDNEFTLDLSGNWNGQAGHDESTAFVRVTLEDLTATVSEFTTFMDSVTTTVLDEVKNHKLRDLSFNLASMMAWQQTVTLENDDGNVGVHVIEFTADVSYVFERYYKVGVLSAVNADCSSFIAIDYDRSTAVVTASFDAVSYLENSDCSTALNPSDYGYITQLSGPEIKIKYDMHSLIIAHAVNNNLVDMDLFTTIPDPKDQNAEITFRGDTYAIRVRVDSKFAGMDPIYCLEPVVQTLPQDEYPFGDRPICSIKIADKFVYPFFNHGGLAGYHGFDINTPTMCSCTEGTGNNEHCSDFDFMTGILMFKGDTTAVTMAKVLGMVYDYSAVEINTMAFNATFAAHRLGGLASTFPPPTNGSDLDALERLSDPVWRTKTYAFCGNCSVFSLHTFDDFNYRINSAGSQMYNASCHDIISGDAEWDDVEAPTQLIEDYFKCTPEVFDSLVNGAGIGVGDATIVVPTMVVLFIPLMHLILHYLQSDESRRHERARFAELHHDLDDMVELDEIAEQNESAKNNSYASVVPVVEEEDAEEEEKEDRYDSKMGSGYDSKRGCDSPTPSEEIKDRT